MEWAAATSASIPVQGGTIQQVALNDLGAGGTQCLHSVGGARHYAHGYARGQQLSGNNASESAAPAYNQHRAAFQGMRRQVSAN